MRLTAPGFAAAVLARHQGRAERPGRLSMAVLRPRPFAIGGHSSHTTRADVRVHVRLALPRMEPLRRGLVERVVSRTVRTETGTPAAAMPARPERVVGLPPLPTPEPSPTAATAAALPPQPAAPSPSSVPAVVVRAVPSPTPLAPSPASAPPVAPVATAVVRRAAPSADAPAVTVMSGEAVPFPPRPDARPAPLPQHEVDRLADRVMDVIERRVGAYRERLGRS